MWLRNALPALTILLALSPAWAQGDAESTTTPGEDVAFYVVRPGDTLEGLTARYLGSEKRWRENWQLNADQIEDPHRIYPGQKIKLRVPARLPDGALLIRVSNRVEDQPTPLVWIDANERDLLRAKDGIKTHEQSSAQLRFYDETVLQLTEQSIVFLGERARATEVDRNQIEVVVGQADLEGPAVAETASEFEIVLGDARATPRPAEDSAVQTRARRATDIGAQLMVYGGESELEAAGAKVTVGTGMGSSVPEGEPPSPPEVLLPAPKTLEPAAGAELATPQPSFGWEAVEGARDYTLEICRDERCGALLERVQALTETSWRPAGLPVEKLYWRVTAIAASGLDGYPSQAVPFAVLTDVPDTTPPRARIAFTGPRLAPRSGLNDRWIVGPGMEIEVEVEDSESGVGGWTAAIDGEQIPAERLKGPWNRGRHTVSVRATDRAGNRSETEVPFIFDPDPPALSWGAEGAAEPLGELDGEADPSGPPPAQRGLREVRLGKLEWRLESDLAHVVARPQSRKPIGLAGLGTFGPENGLWVHAEDEVCPDLRSLTYELVAGEGKDEAVLHVEAVDCVGNARRASLSMVRSKNR